MTAPLLLLLQAAKKAKRTAKAKRIKLKRPTNAQMVRKADILFSLAVRSVGRCAALGEHKGPLQCAHGFSRRYRAVRWDSRNAFSLCAGHHLYFTHRPLEWDEWMREAMGDAYELVRIKALTGPKPDMTAILEGLTQRPLG